MKKKLKPLKILPEELACIRAHNKLTALALKWGVVWKRYLKHWDEEELVHGNRLDAVNTVRPRLCIAAAEYAEARIKMRAARRRAGRKP